MHRINFILIGILSTIQLVTNCNGFLLNNGGNFRQYSAVQQRSFSKGDVEHVQFPQKNNKLPPTKKLKGVIFDMDGTLVKPCIDFADMRKRVYAIADKDSLLKDQPEEKRRGDVLKLYEDFSVKGQKLVKEVFDDIEAKALDDMEFMEGVGDLCQFLDAQGIKRAVLTRNVGHGVDVMQGKLWKEHSAKEFFPAVNRETEGSGNHGPLPMKPAPDAILHICDIWNCSPCEVVMVGDSVADDIAAASRAGCGGSVWLKYNGQNYDNDSGEGNAITLAEREERQPTIVVSNLRDFLRIIKTKS